MANLMGMWVIFILTYLGMALGRFPGLVLDRTAIAVLGAVGMLCIGGTGLGAAAHSIDKPTMLLLFGLMLFTAQLRTAGFPSLVNRFLERFLNRPKLLLWGIIAISAAVSALLANDIVCLAFTPLLCMSVLRAGRDPVPYLLGLATASNIGSAATIIGNPQNMYIGSVAHLQFGHFTLIMLPPALAGLVICWFCIALLFEKRMSLKNAVVETAPVYPQEAPDMVLIVKTISLLILLIGFFLYAGADADKRAMGALVGAGILLISRRKPAAKLFEFVDWNLLLLFVGLFVVNGAMQQHHLIEKVLNAAAASGLRLERPITLSAATTLLSNVVSNVPAVLLLAPTVAARHSQRLWYLLAMVSTLAGNLTLVGSIANLIVAESAARFGVTIDLRTYCIAGVPIALATVTLGVGWVLAVM